MQRTDVAIIGAGQAGLAMSAVLDRAGVDHCVIERGRIGERWRSERRPGLRLLTPAWMTRLPDLPRPDAHPDSFLPTSAFVDILERYAAARSGTLVANCAVETVDHHAGGLRLQTTQGVLNARAVVIATGACDRPAVPDWARDIDANIGQFTPDVFSDPSALPPGGVLVVGASATGMQLAAELSSAGREVTIAAGRHVRAPRRYRDRDLFAWLDACGFLVEQRPADEGSRQGAPSLPLFGGPTPGGGGALELAQLHAQGVRVMGRALGGSGGVLHFAQSLSVEVDAAEMRRRKLLTAIDAHIARSATPARVDPLAWLAPRALPEAANRLDLAAAGIGSVVWATGYRRSYPWLRLPVFGPDGEIRQDGGVTRIPGLYTIGLPFMRHRASALIDGVGRDAEVIGRHICRHLGHLAAHAA